MTDEELKRETRKMRRCEQLGTNEPHCGMCGLTDWRCIELHHPDDHGRDDMTVLLCRNCHRMMSDDQKDHPAFAPDADQMLDAIGHFLLGLADMLRDIVEKLYAFGQQLIERASPVPEPGEAK
jgi:RNA polymerase subunit RPABC4/transcription elongation factor Spt4